MSTPIRGDIRWYLQKKAIVEVPQPPHQLHPQSHPHVPNSRKENAPFVTKEEKKEKDRKEILLMPQKRKASDDLDLSPSVPAQGQGQQQTQVVVLLTTASKKLKMTTKEQQAQGGAEEETEGKGAVESFPNGFFYCHQCSKKRDVSVGIHCTFRDTLTKLRCKTKYCLPCLKNRYGEQVDKNREALALTAGEKSHHVDSDEVIFKCPKCRDVCNCPRCRKAKGLQPTGNLSTLAKRTDTDSAAALFKSNPKLADYLSSKAQRVEVQLKKSAKLSADAKPKPEKKGPRGRPKLTSKVDVTPAAWTPLACASLSLEGALDRVHVREFVLRFANVMDGVGKGCVEELECVAGANGQQARRVGEEEGEECEWVSEACVKALLIGLLGLIVKDAKREQVNAIKGAIKGIRASSANLSKMWNILSSLRDACGKGGDALSFSDPLPAAASAHVRMTRTTREAGGILVGSTAQMVPVLLALCERALQCDTVREELEAGSKDSRDRGKESREGIRRESERWDEVKQTFEGEEGKEGKKKVNPEFKEKRVQHKQTVLALEQSLRISMSAHSPRFEPLGRDVDGRIYWALSPGIGEREAAMELLSASAGEKQNAKSKGRTAKGKRAAEEEERKAMRRWSWFVAVWGRRPDDEDVRVIEKIVESDEESDDDEEDKDIDDGKEKWWGFWDSREIRRLAAFVGRRGGLKEEGGVEEAASTHSDEGPLPISDSTTHDEASKRQLKELIKGLKEYADSLEWRIKRDEADTKC